MTADAQAVALAAVKGITDNAERLGLTWQATVATVENGDNPAAIIAIYDGDTEAIAMTSSVGAIPARTRVFVVKVPPALNLIVGFAGNAPGMGNAAYANFAPTGGGTTTSNYANMPGSPSASITKRYGVATNLEVIMAGTFYSVTTATGVKFGVNVNGVDYDTARVRTANASLTSHTPFSGVIDIPNLPAGTYAVTARWARLDGAGTTTVDVNDFLTFKVKEVWAA